MKCAALVIASRYPAGIGALSPYFAALGADMFVHVDAKIDEAPFREAASAAGGNVHFLSDRTAVFWRGFSMMEATMELLRSAAGKGAYDKFLLISDDSLPLLPPAALTDRLAATDDFVAIGPNERFRSRYTGFYMLDSHATQVRWIPLEQREVTPDAVARFLRLDALRRIGKKPIPQLFHGSQWWCLGAASVARVLDVWATDTWRRECPSSFPRSRTNIISRQSSARPACRRASNSCTRTGPPPRHPASSRRQRNWRKRRRQARCSSAKSI